MKVVKENNKIHNQINTWLGKVYIAFSKKIHDENDVITIKYFIETLQKYYQEFKKEYDELEKIDIGKNNNVLYCDADDHDKVLVFQINEQEKETIVPDGNYRELSIIERNQNITAYFTDETIYDGKTSYLKGIDPKILRGYLDLFIKYKPLFDLYYELYNNHTICRSNNQILDIHIVTHNDSLINNLDGVELYLASTSDPSYIMNIYVDLTDGMKINYDKSSIIIQDNKIKLFSNAVFDLVLNTLIISRKGLHNYNLDYFEQENSKTK